MIRGTRPRVLVLHVHYPETLSYFRDWLDALRSSTDLDVVPANLVSPAGRRRLRRNIQTADLTIALHSVIGDSLSEIERHGSPLLDRRGPLVCFVGNEVSLPTQPLQAKLDMLRHLAPEFVATQLPIDAGEYLYEGLGAKVLAMPHALNPAVFRPLTANEVRRIDIGFRGARYLPHVGDDDRNRIIDYFASTEFDPPLETDINTESAYARRGWARFLNRCKATIGAESGAVELDRDDSVLHRVDPGAAPAPPVHSFARTAHQYLPRMVKRTIRRGLRRRGRDRTDSLAASVAVSGFTVSENAVSGKGISSRHFDAIGTETCQILLPGRYNDLLEPDRHYLCLRADFSNIDDVLARFHDQSHRLEMVRETRAWALDNHTYAHRVRALVTAIGI